MIDTLRPAFTTPGDRPPHVLTDARYSLRKRGGDRCRFELATHLARLSVADYTFLAYPSAEVELRANGVAHAIIVAPYSPDQHPQADLYEHIGLPALARRIGVDIYHGTFNVTPLFPCARATIVTVHDMAVFAFPEAYGKSFAPYMRFLIRAAVRRASRVIAVSEATRHEIVRYLPASAGKIVTIPNGVGAEFVTAPALPASIVKATLDRLQLPSPYVLFVGNLEPKKNLARLIEAFGRLRAASELQHHLVIVGERPTSGLDGGVTVAGGHWNDIVHFTGYVSDVELPALYRGADLVAYPSLYEGFGMPVLEGMAAGIPVLTSTVSSLPEVAAGAALLVAPDDVEAMAMGLYRALTDLNWRKGAVDAGLARAAQLSWEANARRTATLYHTLWDEILGVGISRSNRLENN